MADNELFFYYRPYTIDNNTVSVIISDGVWVWIYVALKTFESLEEYKTFYNKWHILSNPIWSTCYRWN